MHVPVLSAQIKMLIFDQWWWFFIPGLILGFYAQMKVKSTYKRFLQVAGSYGLTGARAARRMLSEAGISDVTIREVSGHLSDHYDPVKKELCLSSENFHGTSLAALGVAAHEAGHALQHQAAYAPLNIRMALVPVTSFASGAAMWIAIGGFFVGLTKLVIPAIVVFGIIALFQLVTLPVEYDASRRAKECLLKMGVITEQEHEGVSAVLNAAALTYVAALVSSLFTLLHFLLIFIHDD